MQKICNLAKHFLIRVIRNIICVIKKICFIKVQWLEKIRNITYAKFCIFYFIFFCIGRLLLFSNPIKYDWIHQIVLTAITFIMIYSLKYIDKMTKKIKAASIGLTYKNRKDIDRSPTMHIIVMQMMNMQNSVWWLIIMVFPAIGFIRKNLLLGFVEKNPAGYYAVFFGAQTFYIALLGYSQILVALFYFLQIAYDRGSCIPVDYPSDLVNPPEWYILWNQLFQKIVRLFFVVGTLFTLEYVLLMPSDVVTYRDGMFIFNVSDTRTFLSSWLTIFICIIVAFPAIYIVISRTQKTLLNNLNKKINYEHTILLQKNASNNSVLDLWIYRQLMETPIKYNDYNHAYQKVIPVASTIISLLLNVFKLYESILTRS